MQKIYTRDIFGATELVSERARLVEDVIGLLKAHFGALIVYKIISVEIIFPGTIEINPLNIKLMINSDKTCMLQIGREIERYRCANDMFNAFYGNRVPLGIFTFMRNMNECLTDLTKRIRLLEVMAYDVGLSSARNPPLG